MLPPKTKSRWTFDGLDPQGNFVFEEQFICLRNRPVCPLMWVADENGGYFEKVPGEVGFDVITFVDEHKSEIEVAIIDVIEHS